MATVIKLAKVGNSIRATIPKEVLEKFSLSRGEVLVVSIGNDDTILLRMRGKRRADTPSRFYGALEEKTGSVEHWPTPEEIKAIWE